MKELNNFFFCVQLMFIFAPENPDRSFIKEIFLNILVIWLFLWSFVTKKKL